MAAVFCDSLYMKTIIRIVAFILVSLSLTACVSAENAESAQSTITLPDTSQLPPTLSYDELRGLLAQPDSPILLLDVRTREEYDAGYIPDAVLAPFDQLQASFKEADKNRPIVVYCRSGNRSSTARRTLLAMGYTNVSDFGAYTKWRDGFVKN